jgi:hypothetical protein
MVILSDWAISQEAEAVKKWSHEVRKEVSGVSREL